MLGERTISHARQRDKEPAHSFRVHDERAHMIFGVGIGLEIRNIIPCPLRQATGCTEWCTAMKHSGWHQGTCRHLSGRVRELLGRWWPGSLGPAWHRLVWEPQPTSTAASARN